jgi:hypothetical protein
LRDEARHEGRVFPRKGTAAYKAFERQALDLLVYHEELRQAAAGLGIRVPDAEIERLLRGRSSGNREADQQPVEQDEEEDASGGPYAEETFRSELLYRRVYGQVTGSVAVTDAELASFYEQHPTVADRIQGESVSAERTRVRANLLDQKRNRAMAAWVTATRRHFAPRVVLASQFKRSEGG